MPIDHENLRLDHNHCRAICDEIGERLREAMALKSVNMPPQLQRLIDRLDDGVKLEVVFAGGALSGRGEFECVGCEEVDGAYAMLLNGVRTRGGIVKVQRVEELEPYG